MYFIETDVRLCFMCSATQMLPCFYVRIIRTSIGNRNERLYTLCGSTTYQENLVGIICDFTQNAVVLNLRFDGP